ncbi:hypothetical protein BGW42_000457 [Actinomortierella wolfii]|nr:hypothetical protein BGW41_001503 [Actinomortierella wolfii]KAG0237629.1 hypothetical protein BGW42_000457 [Actinomortierella wolfii]
MHFTTIAAFAVAAFSAVVSAESAYFPFPPEGDCVSNCTNTVGKTFFQNYNDRDEYGKYFIKSLSYTFERGTPTTIQFMTKAGMCMSSCPQPELDQYTASYPKKLVWYRENKNSTPPPRP